MQANPNIYDVAYTRANGKGQSAARLVRYLTRRPAEKDRPGRESDWHSLPEEQMFGNPESFRREADRRQRERLERHHRNGTDVGQDHSPQNVSYLHVVISPSSREAFRSEDFEAVIDPWIRDRKGRPCPYFAAVHYDDPEGPKVHLAVARDRIHKTRELPQLKEQTAELIQEREMLLERSRYPEHTQEREHIQERESTRKETHTMQDQQQEEQRQQEQEAQREAEEQTRQQEEEAQRDEEAQQEEEQQIEERRRQRLEREAQERDEQQHDREM